MRRLMFDNQIRSIINSGIEVKGLELLDNQHSIGSLSATDEFSSDEIHRFWMNSQNIQESSVTGCETFPGEMLKPSSEIVSSGELLDRIVEYYIVTYVIYNFWKPFGEGPEDSIIINVKICKFGRCRIGSEKFGSMMSSRHVKSSFILAKFIMNNGDVECYPGQVQYYFTNKLHLPDKGPIEHFLAYVRWYKPVNTSNIRYYFSSDDICNVEL